MKPPILVPRHIFWPLAYLATLAISVISLWWVILIGGTPFVFQSAVAITASAKEGGKFRKGSIVGVRREICADNTVMVLVFPELSSADGLAFSLPPMLLSIPQGCSDLSYGFVLPPVPTGAYTLSATARFQNNLVGRDEYASFPPLSIEVAP